MFDVNAILKMLPAIGPIAAAVPEFKKVFDDIVATFKEHDQDTLRAAYNDLMVENDEGHARLQDKLRGAE